MAPKRSAKTILVCAAFFCLMLLTRYAALTHNGYLHPDEMVFYRSAGFLADFLTGKAPSYAPTKYYPEGGFVLLMPFELVHRWVSPIFEQDARFFGRIGGVLYFLIGVGLGLKILRQYFTKDSGTTVIYLTTMLFGLLHVELSRYATGDTASFLFLMLLILFSAKGMESGQLRYFFLASAMGGVLASIKYPLAFFLLIPYLGFRKVCAADEKKMIAKNTWNAAGCFFVGFLLFSPKTLTDPTFLFWTAAHETHNYMAGTNYIEVGGPLNHLFSVIVYTLLYSGFPLLTGLAVWQCGKAVPAARKEDGCKYLFQFVIPLVTGGFFLYNLFVTALFMRTYYPFFVILDIYSAVLCGDWLKKHGWKKAAVIVLGAVMVLRGGYLVWILSTDSATENMQAITAEIPGDCYTSIKGLTPGKLGYLAEDLPQFDGFEDLSDERFSNPETAKLQPGELVISTTQEHGFCSPYPFPIMHKAVRSLVGRWSEFKQINASFEIGRLYPEYFYWMFGYWLKGSTGTIFEFPSNIFYLNPIS